MKVSILLVGIFCVGIRGGAAQERKVAFRTLCLDLVENIDRVVLPAESPDTKQEIQLYTNLSPVVESVFRSGEVKFYVEVQDADGGLKLELAAKGQLGRSGRQLMLFVPTGSKPGSGKLPYMLKCYNDDLDSFGMGHVRAINMAPVPVRFVISGKTTPEIPAGKFAQFPHSTKVNEFNMYPVVTEFLDRKGDWVKGQSVSWKATERRRDIVVTLIDSRFKQPAVRIYTDIPPWTEEVPDEP